MGRELFQTVVDYIKSNSISAFYLFTDTSCNYPFYEHLGLTRCCEKKQVIDVNGEKDDMTFSFMTIKCQRPMNKYHAPIDMLVLL